MTKPNWVQGEGAPQRSVCIVGAGPRGLSVLERLCANARGGLHPGRLTVHVVDPQPPGPGRVWRTDQPRTLLMNTVASQATMFTDDSVDIPGPVEAGPSLYEWARLITLAGDWDDALTEHGPDVLAEARLLGPDSYPTRALYGAYLSWVFRRVVTTAPDNVTVVVHRDRAVGLTEDGSDGLTDDVSDGGGSAQQVRLAGGTVLRELDAVVLCLGHLPIQQTDTGRELAGFAAEHGLRYLPPANPADLDLSAVAPGEEVVLRGLGLNFFDHLALFTIGRGGVFERRDGELVYRASGLEPAMHAGSRRGVPYHARGRNEKGPHGRHLPQVLTPELIAQLRAGGEGLNFQTRLWPLISTEVESVYYRALLIRRRPTEEVDAFAAAYLAADDLPARNELLERYGVAADERWDWDRISRPYGRQEFADRRQWQAWLVDYLAADLAAAEDGNVSNPVKSALDALRDLRNEVRLAVDHGGLDGDSHRDVLDGWYTPLNAFVSIGPPAERIEQLRALILAGVLHVFGPGLSVVCDPGTGRFQAWSAAVPADRVSATTLIEARLPEIELVRTDDELLRQLLADGQCRPHRIPRRGGGHWETGGLAVTARPCRLIDRVDIAHPRRFAIGIPTESVHWATAAGIRPGVNSVTLGDTDAIARAVLDLDLAFRPGTTADLSGASA